MKCEHECAEIVAVQAWTGNPVVWCSRCGSLGKVKDTDSENIGDDEVFWTAPSNQSGICPCGGYQVRAYDAALDSYRLVCEECGR